MKLKITILISLLAVNISLMAQEQPESKKLKHGVGIAAGTTTGHGLSYKFTPNRFAVQLAFAPEIIDNHNIYYTGLTLMFNFIELNKVNFLIYQSNLYAFTQQKGTKYENFDRDDYQYYHSFKNGLGLGVEFIIHKRISLNLMGGYAAYNNNQTRYGVTLDSGIFFKF